MREIKFRAWNEQIKFMGEVRNIDFINGTVEVLIEDNIGYYFEDWKKTDIKTMQYTGLQDENGVDIYEGDIINLSYEYFDGHFRDNEIVGKVCFEGSSFRMSYKKYDEIREWRIDEPEILSIEVIGNIYENPELLEV